MRKLLFILSFLFSNHAFGSYSEGNFGTDLIVSGCPYQNVSKVLTLCKKFEPNKALDFSNSLVRFGCPESATNDLQELCLLSNQSNSGMTKKIVTVAVIGGVVLCSFASICLKYNREVGATRLNHEISFLVDDYNHMISLSQRLRDGDFNPGEEVNQDYVNRIRLEKFMQRPDHTTSEKELFSEFEASEEFLKTSKMFVEAFTHHNTGNNEQERDDRLLRIHNSLSGYITRKCNERDGEDGFLNWLGNSEWVERFLNNGCIFASSGLAIFNAFN